MVKKKRKYHNAGSKMPQKQSTSIVKHIHKYTPFIFKLISLLQEMSRTSRL
jgi:hypothetical protein